MLRSFFITLIFVLGFSSLASAATSDIYSFESSKQQARFQHLSQQFRCLVCQNETLADSNAPLAKDLRFQVYKMIKENKKDQEIIDFLVERYGDFILFRPQIGKLTYILWYGPFVMLIVALARLYWLVNRRKSRNRVYTFSKQDKERIKHLLSQY